MILTALRTLAAAAFDAAAQFTKPPADRLWEDAKRACAERAADELAEREAAEEVGEPVVDWGIRCQSVADAATALLQPGQYAKVKYRTSDGQTFSGEIQRPYTSAAPGPLASPVEEAESPAPDCPRGAGAGHPIEYTPNFAGAAASLAGDENHSPPGAVSLNPTSPVREDKRQNAPGDPGLASVSPADPQPKPGPPRPNVKALRVAARGLREWADGEPCDAVYYWRSIANALEALGVIATTNLADQ